VLAYFSTLAPDVLCKACSYKRSKSDEYALVEWRDISNGKGYNPSFNFVPTFNGPVMISKKHLDASAHVEDRVILPMMWGLIPPWHKVHENEIYWVSAFIWILLVFFQRGLQPSTI
jgi:putative SOS response-associated peptidase YedK